MDNSIYRLKIEELPVDILNKISTNEFKIYDGVVRRVPNFSIVKHIPHEVIDSSNISNLQELAKPIITNMDQAKSMIIGTTVLASAAVIGAVIISTAYLSKKIDGLQVKVDEILKEIQDQNFIHYFEKIVNFFGEVESLREIIKKREVVIENRDLILMKLNDISSSRNQHLLFVDNIIYQIQTKSPKHQELLLDTVHTFLDLLPKTAFVESQAAYKIERFHLGDNIRESFVDSYTATIDKYKNWCNEMIRFDRFNNQRKALTNAILVKEQSIRRLFDYENLLLLQNAI